MKASIKYWLAIALLMPLASSPASAQTRNEMLDRLVRSYPDALESHDDNSLVWRDGTRMTIDDGRGPKPHEALLAAPDIKDVFDLMSGNL